MVTTYYITTRHHGRHPIFIRDPSEVEAYVEAFNKTVKIMGSEMKIISIEKETFETIWTPQNGK